MVHVHSRPTDEPPVPPLLRRLVSFLKIAKWKEIYLPSRAFQKILVGVRQEKNIEGFHKKLLGWVGSCLLCLFVIVPVTPVVLVLGLLTGGYFWPKEMKVYLFFAEFEALPLEKGESEGVPKDALIAFMKNAKKSGWWNGKQTH